MRLRSADGRRREPCLTFEVVFVCTGNRYRSVLAEAAFREAARGHEVRVGSFGTLDVGAAGPLPEALELARGLGLDISRHFARCVVGTDLSDASLVLGFELAHLGVAVADAGAPRERTFMLAELVALLEHVQAATSADPIERAQELVSLAHTLRQSGARPAASAEIEDPIGRPLDRQEAIGHQVFVAAARLAEQLFGPRAEPPTGDAG
jgi:protein-tyrosine phosphatase